MSSPGKNNITYDELLRISKELNKNIIANKSRSKEEKIQTDNFIKQFGISRKDFTATIRKTNICFDRKAGLYEVTKDIDYKNDIKVIAIDEYKKVENIDSNYQNNDKISIDNELKNKIIKFMDLQKDLIELISLKPDLIDMLQDYKSNKKIIHTENDNIISILNIDIPELQGDLINKSIKVYENIARQFDKVCSQYSSIKRQDLYSLALLEFIEKYKKD